MKLSHLLAAFACAATLLVEAPEPCMGMFFSPYKDVTVNMDWNTNVISTAVRGSRETLLPVLSQSGLDTVTWAFATGVCGSETWGGIAPDALASSNIQAWAAAGKKYIISTGGAAGSFKCPTDAAFLKFIERYHSSGLVGIDFDIEGGVSQQDIQDLVQRIKAARARYPGLRFSFTLATLGGNSSPNLGTLGVMAVNAIKENGLTDIAFVNLMAMDYGSASPSTCIVENGKCEMGKSAVRAAKSLHEDFGIPYSQIEVTPMIGGNDSPGQTFTTGDVQTLANFAKEVGLGGIHLWSLDRDRDCPPGSASPICNTYGQAGTLGFIQAFQASLNGGANDKPPSTKQPSPAPGPSPSSAPTTPTMTPPPAPAPSDGKPTEECAKAGCAKGCLWTYPTGTQCFQDYPRESCELYMKFGYTWCP